MLGVCVEVEVGRAIGPGRARAARQSENRSAFFARREPTSPTSTTLHATRPSLSPSQPSLLSSCGTTARRAFAADAAYDINSRTKPHVNVGTIGHVDHGKTTLTAALCKVRI